MENSTSPINGSASIALPTRKRGRPRKEKANLPTNSTSTPAAKKRGRPRKVQKVEATEHQKITNIKKFIIKYHPSVTNGTKETEDNTKSIKMAKDLWEKVVNYEKKYLV
ncbi:hypothetical protein Glove_195g46 [Diversispora epigaea]|uniref:Uncharacterized protein n=1 Tax=Diversispora epigaea TaxID=1348612 RepID=A0A397IKU0_9GLOM|nr:hypothetical protein Glove_195g46 [Diversispora epigaea]